jgi:uncharacterized cupredoxin-like copper-binding protein
MRFLKLFTIALAIVALASACEPGTAPAVETSVPSALQTGAAQAPTVFPDAANTAAAAVQAAGTAAARTGGTSIPSAATAAANAAQTVAPVAQTGAAAAQTAVGTAVPAAQTAAAAAQTAIATPLFILPGAATPAASANVVEARLSEYKIDMPNSLHAGAITFRVTNAGTIEHNFVVDGQGIKKSFDTNLQPNQTNTLQVNLTPGTYQVYCPIDDHKSLGMLVNLTVTP